MVQSCLMLSPQLKYFKHNYFQSWTLTSSQNLLAGYKCLSLAERICYPSVFTKTVYILLFHSKQYGQIVHNERNHVCCFNWAKQFKVPKNAVFPQNPKSESLKVKWGLRSLQITGPSEPGVHGLHPPYFRRNSCNNFSFKGPWTFFPFDPSAP